MKLLAHSSIYLGASIMNAAIPFLLLPLYTRELIPADFARIALIEALITFAFPLVAAGANGAVSIEYFKLNKQDFPRFVASALVIPAAAAMLLSFCVAALSLLNPEVLGIKTGFLLLVPIIVFSQTLMQLALVLYQASQRPFNYGAIQIVYSVLNLGLSVALVVWAGQGWEGRLNALLISSVLAGAASLYILNREGYIEWSVSRSFVQSAAMTGIPLIPHALAMLVIIFLDRFIITKYLGLGALGIYVVGHQIGMSISLVQNAFTQAWTPFLFKHLAAGSEASKILVVRSSYLFAGFLLGAVGLLYLATPMIFDHFIAEQYHGAKDFAVVVGFGFAITGMYKMAVGYIFYEKKTYLLSIIAAINICLSVGLNFVLIQSLGVIGAAYSLVLSMSAVFLTSSLVAARIHPMPWRRALRFKR